jgi:hypothetical protein
MKAESKKLRRKELRNQGWKEVIKEGIPFSFSWL